MNPSFVAVSREGLYPSEPSPVRPMNAEKTALETERMEESSRIGLLADFILGAQDGLVNVLGVALGIAVASRDITIILAGGLAATFAESVAMGAVAYTSTLARREHYLSEVAREKREMEEIPEVEREEVRTIFREWGFAGEELEEMVERIVAKEKAWLELMMAHELKLSPVEESKPLKSGILVGVSAIIGSLIPLSPFFLLQEPLLYGMLASVVASASALFAIGWYKAKTTVGRPGRSGLQMAVIGILAAMAGFAVGLLVGG